MSLNSKQIKCPQCRVSHGLPANGVIGFLPNTHLISKIEKGKSSPHGSLCGMCKSGDLAVCYCRDCSKYLCSVCDQSHKRMSVFELHVTLPPHKAKELPPSVSYKCSDHPDEELKVYCIKCKEVICRDCALYSHEKHSFKPASKATNEVKKSISDMISTTSKKLSEFHEHKQTVQGFEKYITTAPDEMKRHIINEFNGYIEHLNARKLSLLHEVETKFESYSKKVWAEKDSVEAKICGLEACLKFAQRVLQGEDGTEMAVLGSSAVSQLQKVNRITWTDSTLTMGYPFFFTTEGTHKASPIPLSPEFLKKVGSIQHYGSTSGVKPPRLTMKIEGYESTSQNPSQLPAKWLTDHSHYELEKENSFQIKVYLDMDIDRIYPPPELLVTVKHRAQSIVSNLTKVSTWDWKLTFKTVKAGQYEVKIQLKHQTKVIQEKKLTVHFVSWTESLTLSTEDNFDFFSSPAF